MVVVVVLVLAVLWLSWQCSGGGVAVTVFGVGSGVVVEWLWLFLTMLWLSWQWSGGGVAVTIFGVGSGPAILNSKFLLFCFDSG